MAEQRELGVPAMQGMLPPLQSTSQDELHDRICEVRAACARIEVNVDWLEAALASIEALEAALVPTAGSCFKE